MGVNHRMSHDSIQCASCGSVTSPVELPVVHAYDKQREIQSRVLHALLVVGDCFFIGMQPILVYLSKVDGKFLFSPASVNLLTELCKMAFAILMLTFQARGQKKGEKSLLSIPVIVKAAKKNALLAIPAFLYAINNYLKFIMQLYFKPATVKMLSNLKVLVIAVLLRVVMRRKFSVWQWEALCLLLIGISINQLPCGAMSNAGPAVSSIAWIYTFFSVSLPSTASVYNEYALKKQFDTSVHLQNLVMYCYGAMFNLIFILGLRAFEGVSSDSLNIFKGHSRATLLLIVNNAMQGILSSFFFKYADTILKKYSSTVATIFTGLASAALFGHAINANFVLGVSVVLISMHQFFSSMAKPAKQGRSAEKPWNMSSRENGGIIGRESSLLTITSGAMEEGNHVNMSTSEQDLLLPR